MYRPFEIAQFQGLNLVDDPQESGCIDALNVSFDDRGRVKTRSGYTSLATKSGSGGRLWLDQYDNPSNLFFSTDTTVYALSPQDASTSTSFAADSLTRPAKIYSTGSGAATYYFGGDDTGVIRYISSFARLAQVARFCAAQPGENRLVLAYDTSAPGLQSRVSFSDAGDASTFGANNFVDLVAHGDPGIITGMTSWRDVLFVFKASSFYVFYGNSVDSTGEPVFNYRAVNTGIGAGTGSLLNHSSVVAGPDAVYFANSRGVWRTTGGPPEKISQAIDPIFTGNVNAAFQTGDLLRTTNMVLEASERYLYVGYRATTSATADMPPDTLLVYSFRDKQWTVWNIGSFSGLTVGRTTGASDDEYADEALFFANGATVYRMRPDSTTDAGSAISWRWRSGFMDLGAAGSEKVVREWLIDGSGSVTVTTAVNDGSLGSGAAVTLGTAPAVDRGRDRRSVRGRNISLELSGSGSASVSKVVGMISAERAPGLES